MYRCIIIDDEELARNLISTYIDRLDFLELVGSFENPTKALSTLKSSKIDLVFLDIQMPEIKGTSFAKMIPSETRFIFTTAYSEYALEGFNLNALDYLLKPITFERFFTAVNKINEGLEPLKNNNFLTVKSGYDLHKIQYSDIIYIESDSEYVNFHTSQTKIMSYNSLKALELELPKSIFLRVHRSYIINKSKVTSLKGKTLMLGQISIPISSSYLDTVRLLF